MPFTLRAGGGRGEEGTNPRLGCDFTELEFCDEPAYRYILPLGLGLGVHLHKMIVQMDPLIVALKVQGLR